MKTFFQCCIKKSIAVLVFLLAGKIIMAQSATISTPLAIGTKTCNSGTGYSNVYNYNTTTNTLTQVGANCTPSLASPGFSASGGSISFNPADQMMYYIETTNGNNSVVYRWAPGTCPGPGLAATYTYSNVFVVGLDFNPVTGYGYQVEFSTGSAPYSIYLRQIFSFSPIFLSGLPQIINLPAGVKIGVQSGDVVFTPSGKLYFAFDNKLFNLDYSTYGIGSLNAVLIDSLNVGAGKSVVGLAYAQGQFVASINDGTGAGNCSFKEIDISTGHAILSNINLSSATAPNFSALDLATVITGIGASKKINAVSYWIYSPNTYNITYYIKVKNYGNVNLTNVQLADNVAAVFGSAFRFAGISAVGTLPSGLTLNPSFDGNTDPNIFAAGSTMKASPADSATINLTLTVTNPDMNAIYNNSAIATATGAFAATSSLYNAINVKDSSNNSTGLIADPNGNSIPDDAGEGIPTPLQFSTFSLLATSIVNFNAELKDNNVKLDWVITNHQPGAIMNVQRSADSKNFNTLTTITSTENNNNYTWKDMIPAKGINYYRLQISEPGGTTFYSSVIPVLNDDMISKNLLIAPNPFHDAINFSVKLPAAGKIAYRILDFASRTMQAGTTYGQAGQNMITITNLDKMPAGTYILEVQTGNNCYFIKTVKE